MTALEEIQAAIEKLTGLRDATEPGRWLHRTIDPQLTIMQSEFDLHVDDFREGLEATEDDVLCDSFGPTLALARVINGAT